jgi:pimeloyl-ACP methyl ester carboxylesterase
MLTRFRNMDRDWEELAHVADVRVDQPLLFLGGDRDSAVHAHGLEAMKASVPNLRRIVLLPSCGHWTQQKRPDDVNARMIEFLVGGLDVSLTGLDNSNDDSGADA